MHVVQVPQVQIIEKTLEFRVVQTAQCTRTPESLETVPVCEMKPVVTVEMVEAESPLTAVPVSPLSMTAPVVDVPPVMMQCAQQQRVDELHIKNQVEDLAVQIGRVWEQFEVASKRAAVSCAALAPALSRTPASAFQVGDVGCDFSGHRHCEIIRPGYGLYEYVVRVLNSYEDTGDWSAGSWITSPVFSQDGKRSCSRDSRQNPAADTETER